MKKKDIIACRRALVIPGYKTLADVGFDGEWVTPYQKASKSTTGPVLVALHWLDTPSVDKHRDVLKEKGYLPHILFNKVVDVALDKANLTRSDIYVTQAFHLLPRTRSETIPRSHIDQSFDRITRHEVEGRATIALGSGLSSRWRPVHRVCSPKRSGEDYRVQGGRAGRRAGSRVGAELKPVPPRYGTTTPDVTGFSSPVMKCSQTGRGLSRPCRGRGTASS